jgi:hypothetical protein
MVLKKVDRQFLNLISYENYPISMRKALNDQTIRLAIKRNVFFYQLKLFNYYVFTPPHKFKMIF